MDDWITSDSPAKLANYSDALATPSEDAAHSAEQIRVLAEPIIARRTRELCIDHCQDHCYRFRCTVDERRGLTKRDALLCDRGNETYDWMFRDLLGNEKTSKFFHSSAEGVTHYLTKTVASHPFYERFKDMRFGGRVRVPAYIKALHPLAHKVFWLLRKQETTPRIAQELLQSEKNVTDLVCAVRATLYQHDSAHLLQHSTLLSLDALCEQQNESEWDIAQEGVGIEQDLVHSEEQQRARTAYTLLTWQEQFLIDSMHENIGAKAVIQALIDEGMPLDGMDLDITADIKKLEQRLYYLRRKAIAKLHDLFVRENVNPEHNAQLKLRNSLAEVTK